MTVAEEAARLLAGGELAHPVDPGALEREA
jgi:hypothetical protein